MTKGSKAHVPGLLILSVLFWAVLSDAWGYSERFFSGLPKEWMPYPYAYISRLIWVRMLIWNGGKVLSAISAFLCSGRCAHQYRCTISKK